MDDKDLEAWTEFAKAAFAGCLAGRIWETLTLGGLNPDEWAAKQADNMMAEREKRRKG